MRRIEADIIDQVISTELITFLRIRSENGDLTLLEK